MKADAQKFQNVDEYLASFPESTKRILKQIRKIIKKEAPKAEESISYNMPAFKLNGMLVFYAGYKNHIGFYPTPSGIEAFKKELSGYVTSKGAIQFPLDKPIPYELISEIVQFRVEETLENAKTKSPKKNKTANGD